MQKTYIALFAACLAWSAAYGQSPEPRDTSYYNAASDRWTLEVTSTVGHALTCTFTIDGWEPIGNGPQQHHVHFSQTLLVAKYPGYGAAMVSHTDAPAHISSFQKSMTCG